jgi:Spy/CpxP family protein refolding chaperone
MKNWKAILGVLAIFVLGIIAGGLITHRIYQKRIRAFLRGQGAVPAELIVRQMSSQLNLTADQRAQVVPIINDTRQRIQRIRVQAEPQVREAFQETERRVRELLTPEQCAKFDKIVAEHKARWPKVTLSPETEKPARPGGVEETKQPSKGTP